MRKEEQQGVEEEEEKGMGRNEELNREAAHGCASVTVLCQPFIRTTAVLAGHSAQLLMAGGSGGQASQRARAVWPRAA